MIRTSILATVLLTAPLAATNALAEHHEASGEAAAAAAEEALPPVDARAPAAPQPAWDAERVVELARSVHSGARELREIGYTYVTVDSGWGFTSGSPAADVNLRPSRERHVTLEFLSTTLAGYWIEGYNVVDKRRHILETFELLSEVDSCGEGPFFVFAHIRHDLRLPGADRASRYAHIDREPVVRRRIQRRVVGGTGSHLDGLPVF